MSFSFNDLKRVQNESASDYTEKLCYHTDTTAHFGALKIKDKKELLKSIESKDENAINRNLDRIIQKYVTFEPEIDLDDITIQERYQILTYMRRAAAGDSVKIVHQCPECEKMTDSIDYDLSNMTVDFFVPSDEVKNEIQIGDKIRVFLGPMTRKDEKEVEALIKKKKVTSDSEKQLMSLIGIIKKVEMTDEDITGEVTLTPEEKLEFYENLGQNFIDSAIEYMKSINTGVKLPFNFTCSHCGYNNPEEEASVAAFFMS